MLIGVRGQRPRGNRRRPPAMRCALVSLKGNLSRVVEIELSGDFLVRQFRHITVRVERCVELGVAHT